MRLEGPSTLGEMPVAKISCQKQPGFYNVGTHGRGSVCVSGTAPAPSRSRFGCLPNEVADVGVYFGWFFVDHPVGAVGDAFYR
jgi:hypothetical protein